MRTSEGKSYVVCTESLLVNHIDEFKVKVAQQDWEYDGVGDETGVFGATEPKLVLLVDAPTTRALGGYDRRRDEMLPGLSETAAKMYLLEIPLIMKL